MTESSFSEKTAAAKKLFGTAAKLAQKQAELATLNNVTLPKLYHAIGKHMVGSDKLPADLDHHRQRIRQLEAGIAATPEEIKRDPAGGFAAKAKQFAQQAAQRAGKTASDATASIQLHAAYAACTRDVLERYGSNEVPEESRTALLAAIERRTQLLSEIENANKAFSSTSIPSPLTLLAGVFFVLAWLLPFFRRTSEIQTGSSVATDILLKSPEIIPAFIGVTAIATYSLYVLIARPTQSRLMRSRLTLACGVATVLTAMWCISFGGDFFIGYFAWLACFVLLFMELRRSATALPRSGRATLAIAGVVTGCVLLGPAARSASTSRFAALDDSAHRPSEAAGDVSKVATAALNETVQQPIRKTLGTKSLTAEQEPPTPRLNASAPAASNSFRGLENLIPREAKAVAVFEAASAMKTPFGQKNMQSVLKSPAQRQNSLALAEYEAKYGFKLDRDVSRIMVIGTIPRGNFMEGLLMVAFGRFDVERIENVASVVDGMATEQYRGHRLFTNRQTGGGVLYFSLLSRDCLVGTMDKTVLRDALDRLANNSGGPQDALRTAMSTAPLSCIAHCAIDTSAFAEAVPELRSMHKHAQWMSLALEADGGAAKLVGIAEAKSADDAEVLRRQFEQTFHRDAHGAKMMQMIPGGFRPASETMRISRTGKMLSFTFDDLR